MALVIAPVCDFELEPTRSGAEPKEGTTGKRILGPGKLPTGDLFLHFFTFHLVFSSFVLANGTTSLPSLDSISEQSAPLLKLVVRATPDPSIMDVW